MDDESTTLTDDEIVSGESEESAPGADDADTDTDTTEGDTDDSDGSDTDDADTDDA